MMMNTVGNNLRRPSSKLRQPLQKMIRAFDFFKVKVELKIVPLSGPTRSTFQNRL